MGVVNYAADRRVLTVARGHPYDREAFAALLSGLAEYDVCHVEQPAAQYLDWPRVVADFDAILFYDMPGVDFTASSPGQAVPGQVEPRPAYREGLRLLQDAGVGLVFMHHSLAAWPGWPEYADLLGGRFLYRPARVRNRDWPDSGYRHKVRHQLRVAAQHPVTRGLPASFDMVDELYLCPVFEQDVEPLLRSDQDFREEHFYSAARAVAGEMHSRRDWSHPPGSNLVAWYRAAGNSPLVYIQGGDDAEALGNEYFRRLLENAVRWVASEDAREWARQKNRAEVRQ